MVFSTSAIIVIGVSAVVIICVVLIIHIKKLQHCLVPPSISLQSTPQSNYSTYTITVNGTSRQYFASYPNNFTSFTPAIIFYHGTGGGVRTEPSFDELLDTSLDEKGVELILNIIKERVEQHKESIYIISHRKESVKAATGDVIVLEKKNSITNRVDLPNNLI